MINTTAYLQRRTPTAALAGKTPYEVLHKALDPTKPENDCKPLINHLKRTGCVAYHRIPDEKFATNSAFKLDKASLRCMMIGYTESTRIWKLWDLTGKGRAFRSTDVRFIETGNAIQMINKDLVLKSPFPEPAGIPNATTEEPPRTTDELPVNSTKEIPAKTAYYRTCAF